MKTITKISLLLTLAVTTFFIACKNEKVEPTPIEEADTEAPSITISKPTSGMYMVDSNGILLMPLKIQAEISDNDALHMVNIKLYYVEKDTTVMSFSVHPDAATYSLDTTFTNTTPYPLTMMHQNHKLIITTEDHSENSSSDTVDFFIHYMG